MRSVLGSLGVVAWLAFAPAAAAQADDASRSTARELATAGVESYERGSYAESSIKLEKAYAVLRVPSVGLWSARALTQVGKLVQASERYREVLRLDAAVGDSAVQSKAKAEASAELDALSERLPRVVVRVEGAAPAELTIEVDGVAMNAALIGEARPTDPGMHHFVAKRGSETATVDLTIAERETKDVVLRFGAVESVATPRAASAPADAVSPAASPRPSSWSTQKTVAIAVGVAGLAGVGVGSYFGVRAKSKLDRANELGCSSTCPTSDAYDANEDARQAGTISTIAIAVGAVGLAGGIVLFATASPSPTQVGLSTQGAYVRGTW